MRGPTILYADSMSAAIVRVLWSRPNSGSIDGVYRQAVNVAAPAAPGGLVALLVSDVDLPYGIVCSPGHSGTMTDLGLEPGMAALLGDGSLRIPETGVRIVVDGRARIHPVGFGHVPSDPFPAVADKARLAATIVTDSAGSTGLASLLEPRAPRSPFAAHAETVLASVAEALVARDAGRAASAGRALVGLGVGLTPSGDDALVGLAAVLAALGDPATGAIARAWASGAADSTTTVGAALLAHAGRLEFAGPLRSAIRSILGGDEADVRRTVATALSWGATSGADTLVGVLAGIEVALERSRRARAAA